jgi:glycosyltransferase involved in cell wall biosynthesis
MDGLPNVVLEAAAMGVPLVATSVGGLGDLVRDGETGLVARPGDADDLAAKLDAVVRDPDGALRRAHRAREAVEARFSEERTILLLLSALGVPGTA